MDLVPEGELHVAVDLRFQQSLFSDWKNEVAEAIWDSSVGRLVLAAATLWNAPGLVYQYVASWGTPKKREIVNSRIKA